jgi:adenylosuccinate synthase
MLVNPLGLHHEATTLAAVGVPDALARLTIDERARLVSPYQQAANWVRELARGNGRHGSCGEGIGETMADWLEHKAETLVAADLWHPHTAHKKLEFLRQLKLAQLEATIAKLPDSPALRSATDILFDAGLSEAVVDFYRSLAGRVEIVGPEYLHQVWSQSGHTIFEGAQGVLLDEWRGFHPYTTWSTTTHANALELLIETGFDGPVTKLGLVRAYGTRHGAGPFVTEDAAMTAEIPDTHNGTNAWQREFRVGHFDVVATRYALEVCGGADGLVITNVDRLYDRAGWQAATAYQFEGSHQDRPAAFGQAARITRLEPGH